MYEAKKPVTTSEAVQAILGEKFDNQERKVIDHIDALCRAWIERSPFITIATTNRRGQVDVAPKGDPAGFVTILDERTLAIPDRLGNNRGDTLHNIVDHPRIGLMFMVPLRNEVLRVSGGARIVQDDEILETMVVNDKQPDMAILVDVEEAMFHCGKSIIRSRLWQPDAWASVDGLPSYASAVKTHAAMPEPIEYFEAMMKFNDEQRLY